MFTFGIFTTHLPYVALVVFYAYFWIIGVNKASSGELQTAESNILIEISAGNYSTEIDQNDEISSPNFTDEHFLTTDYNVAFAALQKLKHKCFPADKQPQLHIPLNLFSRPPPVFS